MVVSIWAKRVADPLDDKVKARFLGDDCRLMAGCASSGSEHEATDPSCFSGLVHAFLEEDGPRSAAAADDAEQNYKSESDSSDRSVDSAAMVRDLLEMSRKKDPFRLRLLSDVSELAEALVGLRSRGSGYRQAVMGQLRESGYNAGLCKARWVTCGGLVAAGTYEYIDVIVTNEGSDRRYLVDLDFSEQFEVARATEECAAVVGMLPRVMVGTAEEVRQLVRIMGDATRRSLRGRDMHVPPWRKTKYMLAKWFGPYRRTIVAIPSSGDTEPAGLCDVKCRAVGFHAAQRLVIPPATR